VCLIDRPGTGSQIHNWLVKNSLSNASEENKLSKELWDSSENASDWPTISVSVVRL